MKKQTFWLYYGNKLVTGVRLLVGATDAEVISHAYREQQDHPTISALWPTHSYGAILMMIARSRVERA